MTKEKVQEDRVLPRITFLALARDCEPYLPLLFNMLDYIDAKEFDVKCLVGENGSRDATRSLIEKRITIDARISLVSTEEMSAVPSRLARMAKGREILRKAWLPRQIKDEYVCVVDVDNVLPVDPSNIDLVGAISNLNADAAISGISATSYPYYYDLLALRAPGIFNYDVGPMLQFGRKNYLFHYWVHRYLIYPMQRYFSKKLPIATLSSFNGLCLYRSGDYINASYCRLPVVDQCEHVDFNLQLCGSNRHIISGTWFKLAMPPEHGPRGLIGFLVQRFKKALKKI